MARASWRPCCKWAIAGCWTRLTSMTLPLRICAQPCASWRCWLRPALRTCAPGRCCSVNWQSVRWMRRPLNHVRARLPAESRQLHPLMHPLMLCRRRRLPLQAPRATSRRVRSASVETFSHRHAQPTSRNSGARVARRRRSGGRERLLLPFRLLCRRPSTLPHRGSCLRLRLGRGSQLRHLLTCHPRRRRRMPLQRAQRARRRGAATVPPCRCPTRVLRQRRRARTPWRRRRTRSWSNRRRSGCLARLLSFPW